MKIKLKVVIVIFMIILAGEFSNSVCSLYYLSGYLYEPCQIESIGICNNDLILLNVNIGNHTHEAYGICNVTYHYDNHYSCYLLVNDTFILTKHINMDIHDIIIMAILIIGIIFLITIILITVRCLYNKQPPKTQVGSFDYFDKFAIKEQTQFNEPLFTNK